MHNAYLRLSLMTVLSFVAMYALMYAMVDRFSDVYPSLNQFYMAALMTAAMVIIEIAVMWGMYARRMVNIAVVAVAVLALAGSWLMIRQQSAIADDEFLRSMIPHHSGAILMCREAPVSDAEIKELCRTIMAGQQAEIDQMKAMLDRLEPAA